MRTAKQMIERINDNILLAGLPAVPPAMVMRKIESAHQRIALELGFPRRYIKGVDATAEFTLPSEAQPGSLIYIEIENALGERQKSIPTLTVQEANNEGVQWDVTDTNLSEYRGSAVYGRYLVVYDPGNITAPVYPLGFDAGDTLRIMYAKRPAAMAAISDTPFGGKLGAYADDMLVQYVSFEFMLARGLEQAQAFYNDFLGLRERAYQAMRPWPWLPRSQAGEQA